MASAHGAVFDVRCRVVGQMVGLVSVVLVSDQLGSVFKCVVHLLRHIIDMVLTGQVRANCLNGVALHRPVVRQIVVSI